MKNIKILGTGCPNCQRLETNVKKALEELRLEASVEKVTDIQDIMSYGVMSTPALVANEKVISYGAVPTVEEIKKILTTAATPAEGSKKCSCGSGCC